MGIARQVYEFLKSASVAHAKWDYEVSMSIIRSKKRLAIIAVLTLPIIFIAIALIFLFIIDFICFSSL